MKNEELLFELKQSLKEEILSEMTAQDKEVLTQHCRLFKLFCWVWFGHLYRDGVCMRCGAKQFKK